ncbi:MAG: DNA adenine methylase [Oscillospiraceae bacterium]|nr:DNA adenine methylase [Oscillospiraceae bacterium]
MNKRTPHIVQYQGSKRILAPQILQYMPSRFERLYEPFSGMAAISIAVAQEKRTGIYHINDINAPLVGLLSAAIDEPDALVSRYTFLWKEQFDYGTEHERHFYEVRRRFNAGEKSPENMLYLLARCVKGAVRYGKDGNFNQSPDRRRHGTSPENIKENINAVSSLLRGKSAFSALDYREIFEMAGPGDLVYMDPPYQGTTNVRDNRYYAGVPFAEFAAALESLNRKNVDFLISYDGACGGKEYGEELPKELECKKLLLNAGRSTQATLLGQRATTYEALYISRNLQPYTQFVPRQMSFLEVVAQ